MKKSTLFGIIIGLVALLGAIAGALYILKKRGFLLFDDCCEYDFDGCCCDEDHDGEVIEEKPSKRASRKAAEVEEVQEVQEG